MPLQEHGFYQFGEYQIDIEERVLLRDNSLVHLTPKAFDVLLFLVQHPGQIVDKDALIEAVWPDVAVEEGNLTFNVNVVRKALGTNGGGHEYIRTIHRRGYRFVAEVSYCGGATPASGNGTTGNGVNARTLHDRAERQDSPAEFQPDRFDPLLAFVSRHRGWLLAIGIVLGAAVLLDLTLVRPQGAPLLRDVAAAALAAVSLYFFFMLSRRIFARFSPAEVHTAAFRGLLPFEPTDANRFYGRNIETAAITDLVIHSQFRFGVLYGDSGCGKTSVLRAALLPALEMKGYLVVHCRSYKNPLEILIEEWQRRTRVMPRAGEPTVDYLYRVAQRSNAGLVVLCDQFEEFYIHFANKRDRAPFVRLVADCYRAANLPIKFLFTIRSDFLYQVVSTFDEHIPEALVASGRYHLQNLDEDQALEVIDKSVRQAKWQFETGLSRRVARDLARSGTVLPSELQIVGEQLQNRRIFTLDQYRREGGKEQLVHSYLEDAIRLAADRQTAQLVLRCLISDEDTRLTLPLAEIYKRVQRSEKSITNVLKLFVEMRLLREIQDEDLWRYELMHEYLIEKINQATGKVMDATQRANRQLGQYLSNYAVDRNTRIPLPNLLFIRRYSDLERDQRQRELMRRSLHRGLLQTAIFGVLLGLLVTGSAAFLSVTEQWETVRLSDGHTAGVHRAAFSPDGSLLVSCGEDGKVMVWDVASRLRRQTLSGHTGWVNALAFSPDGKWLASGGSDHNVNIWNATTWNKVATLTEHKGMIGGIAFSPDGRFLATSAAEDSARTILWETGTWSKAFELPAGVGNYGSITFSQDSKSMLLSTDFVIWDLAAKQPRLVNRDWGSNWIAVAPGEQTSVGVDPSGRVKFIDLKRNQLIAEYMAHQDNGRAAAFSPDGQLVATGAEKIILWNAITHTRVGTLRYPSVVWSLAFSPDGRWLVSTHGDGSILIWNPRELDFVANFNEHSAAVRAVAYSADGQYVASGGEDDSVIVWNAATRRKERVLTGHGNKIIGLAFSENGKSLISADYSGVMIDWDLEQGRPRWRTPAAGWNVCLAASPDGHWVATSRTVYSAVDGTEVPQANMGRIVNTTGPPWAASFSPDGRWLVYPTSNGHFVVWDTRTWQGIDQKMTDKSLVAISFSPDGKSLVTGDDDGAVDLWQFNPLRQLATIGQHSARVKSVAFSPDGTQVASAGDDQAIDLWDVKRRRLISSIGSHTAPVIAVAFSADGKHLVSGEQDASVRIYTHQRSVWGHRLD